MKNLVRVLLLVISFFICSYLLMSNQLIPQICDVSQTAFCKNNPASNTGYCESNGGYNGVCCIFSTSTNKDCYDV